VPNWNSIGIPVTTPTVKFTAKIFAQKCAVAAHVISLAARLRVTKL
jgi:hypothetical protein